MDLARVAVIIEYMVITALLIPVCIGLSFVFTIWLMNSSVNIFDKLSKGDKDAEKDSERS